MACTRFPCVDEMPLMEVARFEAHQFRYSMSSHAAAHCGSKEEFPDALSFWLWSLQYAVNPASDDCRAFTRESVCDAVTIDEYFAVVEGFVSMLKRPGPAFLTKRTGFIRATRVFYQSFINNMACAGYLSEYHDDRVAFHSWVYL